MANAFLLVPFGLVFVLGFLAIVGNVALYAGLRQRGIRLDFSRSSLPGYVLSSYRTHRKALGSRWLDGLTVAVVGSIVLLPFAVALLLFCLSRAEPLP